MALLGLWAVLFHVIGNYTWGYGPLSFSMLMLVAALLAGGQRFGRRLAALGSRRLLRGLLGVVLAGLLVQLGLGLGKELERSRNQRWAIDIAVNTYVAGSAFLEGNNPYAERAQRWHRIKPGPNVEIEDGEVRMFGVPYSYGFPYFPGMFLSYLPGRLAMDGYHAIRVQNGILLLLNLVGLLWLVRRLARPHAAAPPPATEAPVSDASSLGLLACVAYLGISVLQEELFRFAITDLIIATYALFAFVALSHGRYAMAGVLLGLAQACKLLPAPLLVLPVLLWRWRRPGFVPLSAGYLLTSLAVILPFVWPDPERFLSSTVLFYLTHHAGGDDTSLWYFLPTALQPWFRALGYLLSLGIASWPLWLRLRADNPADAGEDFDALGQVLTCAFTSYVVFVAFSPMTHLNYLWGVYTLGCAALAWRVAQLAAPTPNQALREDNAKAA